ncbi:MAG: hypothetical protein LBH02_01155 [Methanocalculaceae archaeon]|jgi:hypothetical protein|nr:hypothetical protein [Methanocalculaceae archaeon]
MGNLLSYSFAQINVIKIHKLTEDVDFTDLEVRHYNPTIPTHWIRPIYRMVNESTIFWTSVNSIKTVHEILINMDAKFNHQIHRITYNTRYKVIVTNKADIPVNISTTITTDTVTILSAGMYNRVIPSQYNCQPQHLKILVNDDKAKQTHYTETHKDMTNTIIRQHQHRR